MQFNEDQPSVLTIAIAKVCALSLPCQIYGKYFNSTIEYGPYNTWRNYLFVDFHIRSPDVIL